MIRQRERFRSDGYDIQWTRCHSGATKSPRDRGFWKNRINRRARRQAKHDLASERIREKETGD